MELTRLLAESKKGTLLVNLAKQSEVEVLVISIAP